MIDSSREGNIGNKTVSNTNKCQTNGIVKFAYFNARSIANKLKEFKLFVSEENVDIVGISETWLTDSITEQEVSIDGFTLYRKDRQ